MVPRRNALRAWTISVAAIGSSVGAALSLPVQLVPPAQAQQPEAVSAELQLFAVRREPRLGASGEQVLTYVRKRGDGTQVVRLANQFEPTRRQMEIFLQDNPWTAKAWGNCPKLTEYVADRLESGVEYMGSRDGTNIHPHAVAHRFWSKEPVFSQREANGATRSWGDPVDGSVLFLLELHNALRYREFQQIWTEALESHRQVVAEATQGAVQQQRWQQNRDRWLLREAQIKADNLAAAVLLVEENSVGLHLQTNLQAGYGRTYGQYARWIAAARGQTEAIDKSRLAQAILQSNGVYRDNPDDAGQTYQSRLERLFTQAMPRPRAN